MAFLPTSLPRQTAAAAVGPAADACRRPARRFATAFLPATAAAAAKHRSTPAVVAMPPPHGRSGTTPPAAALAALLFDCDGVLADTERDAHRPAFNAAFSEEGLPDVWSEEQYGVLLETGGGKERMTAYWNAPDRQWPASAPDGAARSALVARLHARKTALFTNVVSTGAVSLRPGVVRLIGQALAAGVPVAVCSTSNEQAVRKIVGLLGDDAAARIPVFAGDMVAAKKPAPDVYLLAAEQLGVDPADCAVVEDSGIGVAAALAAGMRVLVTVSTYTAGEKFDGAFRVVDDLDTGGVDLALIKEMMA